MNKLRKSDIIFISRCRISVLTGLLLMMTSTLFGAERQAVSPTEVLQTVRGTIQELKQNEGYITVSGRQVGFSHGETEIYLNGVLKRASVLDEGMVIRYTINAAGIITKIEILGPLDKIRLLNQH
ncbi:MAG: hypothetical protein WD772_09555 [Pseudohongiellaceae bacterium]